MIKLLLTKDQAIVQEFDLVEGITHVGRSSGNEIRLDDMAVSGKHAEITVKPNEFIDVVTEVHIQDLDSTNGTFINGKRVTQAKINHNDEIQIGSHRFKLDLGTESPMDSTRIFLPDSQ